MWAAFTQENGVVASVFGLVSGPHGWGDRSPNGFFRRGSVLETVHDMRRAQFLGRTRVQEVQKCFSRGLTGQASRLFVVVARRKGEP